MSPTTMRECLIQAKRFNSGTGLGAGALGTGEGTERGQGAGSTGHACHGAVRDQRVLTRLFRTLSMKNRGHVMPAPVPAPIPSPQPLPAPTRPRPLLKHQRPHPNLFSPLQRMRSPTA